MALGNNNRYYIMKALIAIAVLGIITFASGLLVDINHGWLIVTLPAALITIWLVFSLFGSVTTHLDDLAKLAYLTKSVTSAEERLESVKALAADKHGLPEQLLALKQEDNPVTKYMGLVNQAITNVEISKDNLARYTSRIGARAVGPFSIVVDVLGSTVPE